MKGVFCSGLEGDLIGAAEHVVPREIADFRSADYTEAISLLATEVPKKEPPSPRSWHVALRLNYLTCTVTTRNTATEHICPSCNSASMLHLLDSHPIKCPVFATRSP